VVVAQIPGSAETAEEVKARAPAIAAPSAPIAEAKAEHPMGHKVPDWDPITLTGIRTCPSDPATPTRTEPPAILSAADLLSGPLSLAALRAIG
jgi:hypothetical protein